MSTELTVWEALGRLALAIALAGFIGWEREQRGKPAGLRTNMMVGLGAAMFTVVGIGLVPDDVSADPTRIITGVATGIGFLGAGAILQSNGDVRGITTAAAIWVGGAVGAACGVGEYGVAIGGTVLALVVLHGVGKLESIGQRRPKADA